MDLIGKLIYDESPNIKKVKSWGYGAQIKPPGECFVFKVTQFRVTGDKNIQTKVSFDFVWDGDQILPPSDSILKDIGF
jgi:LPS-assembly protein